MATQSKTLTDTHDLTKAKSYPALVKVAKSYVLTTRNKCWELVDIGFVIKGEGYLEDSIRAMFNLAIKEACGSDNSTEYKTMRQVGAKATKIVSSIDTADVFEWRKKGKGFIALYESIAKPKKEQEGRPNGNQKQQLTKDTKDGVVNSDALLGSLMKGESKNSSTPKGEEEKKGWTAKEVASKSANRDDLYEEIKSFLIGDKGMGRLHDVFIKLSDKGVLTVQHMRDLLETYFNSDRDKAEELVHYLLTEDEWIREIAREWFAKSDLVKSTAKIADETARKVLDKMLTQPSESEGELAMKQINARKKKALVGKKRG
jgi:hypothetical protein